MLLTSSVLPGIGSSRPSPKDPISYCSEKLIVFRVRDQDVDAKRFIYLFIYLAPRMSFNTPDGQGCKCRHTCAHTHVFVLMYSPKISISIYTSIHSLQVRTYASNLFRNALLPSHLCRSVSIGGGRGEEVLCVN